MVLDNFRRAVFTPLILAVGFIGYPHSQASAFETSALQAAVVDMQTGATLLQKDADT
ncbi:MAG: hypothetical protein HOI19_07400, partial [Rhodospirillaceae bacterium]|nr:hypothetical protein [Rhodospirillaceae bacterium]